MTESTSTAAGEAQAARRLFDLARRATPADVRVARAERRALGRSGEPSHGTVALDTTPRLCDALGRPLEGDERAVLERLGLDDWSSLPALFESLRRETSEAARARPAHFTQVATVLERAGLDGATHFATSAPPVVVPAGYALFGYHAEVSYVYRHDHDPELVLSVGERHHVIASATRAASPLSPRRPVWETVEPAAERLTGALLVSVAGSGVQAYDLKLVAVCRLGPESLVPQAGDVRSLRAPAALGC